MSSSHDFESATRARRVDRLESFCRSEMSAVHSYAKALSSPTLRPISDILQSCHASHESRASALADRILELGGRVPESMGVWGSLMPFLESAAAAISAKMAVAVLEEGEDRCLREYRENLAALDPDTRRYIEQDVLPAQTRTHQAISNLKHAMS